MLKPGDRIYLAGPFTTYEDARGVLFPVRYNIERALSFVPLVRELGLVPCVPHVMIPDPGPGKPGWRLAMRECLSHLRTTQATFMLPGWEHSRGAIIERWSTSRAGRPVIHSPEELRAALEGFRVAS